MGEIGYIFNLLFTFPIFNVLMLIYYAIGDMGLSIIVLTLFICLLIFPLTMQQLKSMKAMQALQPQLNEIKRKYAKDQREQALQTQELFKASGVNPFGSLGPLLLQMPALYGINYALGSMLQNDTVKNINSLIYPFLPHFQHAPSIQLAWFTFLNASWSIPLNHPDPTHILPIIAGLATFAQMRLSMAINPTPVMAGVDETQKAIQQQQKMMRYIFPFITIIIGWNFAAGVAIYWTVRSVFTAFQQYFVIGKMTGATVSANTQSVALPEELAKETDAQPAMLSFMPSLATSAGRLAEKPVQSHVASAVRRKKNKKQQ